MASFKHCLGCKANDGWEECPVRKCAKEKGVEICYECNNFPCKILKEQFAKNINVLKEMKELGIEKWLELQLKG